MESRIDRQRLDLPILFETAHEVAVIKPSGMATEVSHDTQGTSLISRVKACAPSNAQPRLPHRLDRVSRGIVVVALTREAVAYHNAQIQEQAWNKLYLARCLAPAAGSFEDLIGLHRLHLRSQGGRARVVRSGGRPAMTEILEVAPAPDVDGEVHALIRLHTGRFHQIRATLAHLGAPLVDDWVYGSSPGRGKERFYLEHTALRMTPFGVSEPVALHWADDPYREPMASTLQESLDHVLRQWENEGAIRVGGRHAEER